jgi:hypothetical protein
LGAQAIELPDTKAILVEMAQEWGQVAQLAQQQQNKKQT